MESLRETWQEVKENLAMQIPFSLEAHTMAVFRVGSHSHGTYIPPDDPSGVDDVDLMVIVMPPPQYKLGLKKFDNATYQHGRFDVVVYDYEKWITLLMKQNPNVIGTLFLHPEDMLIMQDYSHTIRKVLNNTHKVVSKQMAAAFLGYANAQLYKMTHYAHQGYMGAKRKKMVEKFGYDVKNGAHMIRLLRMCLETLNTGRMQVRRPDAQEIIAIKLGAWSKERVLAEGEALTLKIKEALATSLLPDRPDTLQINRWLVDGYMFDWINYEPR